MDENSTHVKCSPHSSQGPLQKQKMTIAEATQTMALPEKSTRPLKKRRIVSIEPEEEAVHYAHSRPSNNNRRRKARKKKAKRARTTVSPLPSPSTSPATVTKKSVSWNDRGGNVVHVQPDPTKLYPCLNESDLWYTRNDYQDFLLDRLQTIESHRYLTANNMNDDSGNYSGHCIRGLELFHEETTNEQFQSKKKLYHSTIQMEQMRQAMLGINDPERFRELVASQSDLALHRAQELAAQDAWEAYSLGRCTAPKDRITKSLKSMSTSSFSDMNRLDHMMESIYGNAASRDLSSSTGISNTPPAPFHPNSKVVSSLESSVESGGASVVSDVSSTGSTESSSSHNSGQSLFADESIRKLQERSMRRLMGIYQNNNGDGREGSNETKTLFKFAKRDSLLGICNTSTAANNTNAPRQNSSWAVPPPEDKTPSPQEQQLKLLHRRQLLQEHHEQQQQQASPEDTTSLEEQIVEMLRQRQLLQEHLRQQLEQQQQAAATEDTTPSLQEQLMEMMERRKILEGHGRQHQTTSSVLGSDSGNSSNSNNNRGSNTTSLIEEYLIQQQQHHEDHKNKMKLALMAMGTTRFPIRRDTLSHVHRESHQNEAAAAMNHHTLPWSLSGMA